MGAVVAQAVGVDRATGGVLSRMVGCGPVGGVCGAGVARLALVPCAVRGPVLREDPLALLVWPGGIPCPT